MSSHMSFGQEVHQRLNKLEHHVSDVLGQATDFAQSGGGNLSTNMVNSEYCNPKKLFTYPEELTIRPKAENDTVDEHRKGSYSLMVGKLPDHKSLENISEQLRQQHKEKQGGRREVDQRLREQAAGFHLAMSKDTKCYAH